MKSSLPSSPNAARRFRYRAVAAVSLADGPPMLRSENARLSGWIYVDIRGRDLGSVVRDAGSRVVRKRESFPPGVFLELVRPVRVPRTGRVPDSHWSCLSSSS
jgi:Cu(I)/Ag(I) efflux system membrane protein CusA/SilA